MRRPATEKIPNFSWSTPSSFCCFIHVTPDCWWFFMVVQSFPFCWTPCYFGDKKPKCCLVQGYHHHFWLVIPDEIPRDLTGLGGFLHRPRALARRLRGRLQLHGGGWLGVERSGISWGCLGDLLVGGWDTPLEKNTKVRMRRTTHSTKFRRCSKPPISISIYGHFNGVWMGTIICSTSVDDDWGFWPLKKDISEARRRGLWHGIVALITTKELVGWQTIEFGAANFLKTSYTRAIFSWTASGHSFDSCVSASICPSSGVLVDRRLRGKWWLCDIHPAPT